LKYEQDIALHHEYQRNVDGANSVKRKILQLDVPAWIDGGFTIDFQYVIFFVCKLSYSFMNNIISSFGGTAIIPFKTGVEMLTSTLFLSPPPPPKPQPPPPAESEAQIQVKRHFMFTEDLLAKLKSASESSSGGAARQIKMAPVVKEPEMQIGKPL
jgi:hypothetical protein